MKKVIFICAIVLLFGLHIALAQKGQPNDPNRQKNPDVRKEYDKHQQEYKEYEVKESVGTVNGVPTPEEKHMKEMKKQHEKGILLPFPNPCNSSTPPKWCFQ